jgi:hypothetical protein
MSPCHQEGHKLQLSLKREKPVPEVHWHPGSTRRGGQVSKKPAPEVHWRTGYQQVSGKDLHRKCTGAQGPTRRTGVRGTENLHRKCTGAQGPTRRRGQVSGQGGELAAHTFAGALRAGRRDRRIHRAGGRGLTEPSTALHTQQATEDGEKTVGGPAAPHTTSRRPPNIAPLPGARSRRAGGVQKLSLRGPGDGNGSARAGRVAVTLAPRALPQGKDRWWTPRPLKFPLHVRPPSLYLPPPLPLLDSGKYRENGPPNCHQDTARRQPSFCGRGNLPSPRGNLATRSRDS